MEKTITIYDFLGNPTPITIPEFEHVVKLVLRVLSGDEILIVHYDDRRLETYDSCPDRRVVDYFDGEFDVPLALVDKISEIPDSYDAIEFFGSEEEAVKCGVKALFDLM